MTRASSGGPLSLALGVLAVTAGAAGGWGPHTEITAAALPGRDRLRTHLGADFDRLARDTAGPATGRRPSARPRRGRARHPVCLSSR